MRLDFYHWKEVLGNNVVQPKSDMLYTQTPIQRRARVKAESSKVPQRLLNVYYDRDFVKWRLSQLFKDFVQEDKAALTDLCDEVIQELELKSLEESVNEQV